ncbi:MULTISPECIES: ACP S-malonyltransferase [Actinomadura]|uniref:[acyl-carrier-protein] S-malonyltransferase n=1 Tax=Actinomadura madurae TaxID=1993 RepID=A0A1I5VQD1_9ACTN|nr:ACP S-malonyltransferase [Actinomadura madurae]URM94938.1 ACP S-malonyltransferase [Actinomadura madurae]SFQ09768.1 [acyl-carrier-protein] S-malonyltransferase [Actinomadura madurae]SPT49616.1 Malonyl CoA-acyl carrier protein transacylase [Actinomadura madurae]
MILLASPGQGAQTPGFLQPWLEIPGVADRLAWWSAVTGLDLARYGTTADAEEIRDTAVAQPLLVAAALAACEVLYEDAVPDAVAGHSVGELAAAAIAGVLTPEAALVLVRERGRAMAEAAAVTETGMTAVLGGDTEEVLASIDKHGLTPANVNGAGQVVAAGTLERLARFADEPPAKARLRPLQVAGAFHTEHMEPAVGTLARLAPGAPVADPRATLLQNRDGAVVTSGRDFLARLVDQVSAPVRWDACMATMRDLGVTAIIELPPAGTLTGLARRELKGVELVALKTPADLDKARELIKAHAS